MEPSEVNLANIEARDLSGQREQPPQVIMHQLPAAVMVGKRDDFVRLVTMTPGITGAMWNESKITLISSDHSTIVQYVPDIHPYCKPFIQREEKRTRYENIKMWDGEFEPVQFSKQSLLKFIKLVGIEGVPKETVDAIKNMRVVEKKGQTEDISLDGGDDTKITLEESLHTNLPRKFTLVIPVTEDFIGHFEFEAKVVPKRDKYDNEDPLKKAIELRCLNARQVLRDGMEQIVKMLPKSIPAFYGKLVTRVGENEIW